MSIPDDRRVCTTFSYLLISLIVLLFNLPESKPSTGSDDTLRTGGGTTLDSTIFHDSCFDFLHY